MNIPARTVVPQPEIQNDHPPHLKQNKEKLPLNPKLIMDNFITF
jgi:phenolic acid decarboxylase